MKKMVFYAVILGIIILNSNAICYANARPEQVVADFYKWYGKVLSENEQTNIIDNNDVFNYIYKCTVEKIRIEYERGTIYSEYFSKSQDITSDELNPMNVGEATYITNDVAIVPVGMNWFGNTEATLIVFVQKFDEQWRITKVESEHFFE